MKNIYSEKFNFGRWLIFLFVLAILPLTAKSQEKRISDVLSEALELRIWGEFDKAVNMADALLTRENLAPEDSIAIFEVLSMVYDCKGSKYHQKSLEYLVLISEVGPCKIRLPRENWPTKLRRDWYQVAKSMDKLTCPEEVDTTETVIQTVAVFPFDNFSIGEYQEKLGSLGAGLAQGFLNDFRKVSSLRVVERDKIDFIINELKLAESGKVDQTTALKAGKLLNAHLMIFGSFTQLSKNSTQMVLRVVNVETSEIVATVSEDGKPDYFKIQKSLVKGICDKLEILLSKEEIKEIEVGGTESLDATTQYSIGLKYEDEYDYKKAFEYFKTAYELDNDFVEAKRKMDIYRPLAS